MGGPPDHGGGTVSGLRRRPPPCPPPGYRERGKRANSLLWRYGGFVAGAFGGWDGDGDGGAVGALGLLGGVDGDEGGEGAHQVVFEGQGADGGGEVVGRVPGGAVGEVGDLLAAPDGAEGGV